MEKEPRKFCKPGDTPETSPEPCVLTGINDVLQTVTWVSVSLEGEETLMGEDVFEDTTRVDIKRDN